MIDIVRERYVIIKDNDEIYCGLPRYYDFEKISNIGNTPIKTYVNERIALSSFIISYGDELVNEGRIKIVKVTESIKE